MSETEEPSTSPITYHDNGTATILLQRPLQPLSPSISPGKKKLFESEEVSELTIRRVYAGDLVDLDGVEGENKRRLKLIEAVSGVSMHTLRRIALRDFELINEALNTLSGND